MSEDFEFGRVVVRVGKSKNDMTVHELAVDRIAATREGRCYLLGVVSTQANIKALRASMNAMVGAQFELQGVPVSDGERGGNARAFHVDEHQKFDMKTASLGFGWTHALFLSRAPGFLRVISDEAVYNELKRPEYTTPLLRSWVGPIAAALKAQDLLRPLYCWRCRCGLITATDEDLDRIVEAGVRDGSLPFRELALVGD